MLLSKTVICAAKRNLSSRKRLVILGCGWGAYSVFKNVDRKKYDVTVISPRNHFLFTPLLCSTTVGTLEFRSIIEPIRNTKFRKADDFQLAHAVDANLMDKTVRCKSVIDDSIEFNIKYDKLVIGVGALPNTFGIKGVNEYAHFLKEIADARRIRNKIIDNIELSMRPNLSEEERKRLLTFVIVGGGPTGVEFGAELYDFIREDAKRLFVDRMAEIKVALIEGSSILTFFDKRLRDYAERKISSRRNFHLIKSTVTEVLPNCVHLKNGDVLPCGLVVWSTGLAPRPFTSQLAVKKSARGHILVDGHLQLVDNDSAYALGDCCEIVGNPLPSTAQVAERQGRYLANLLNSDSESKPFSFQSQGMLAYVGDYRALANFHTSPGDLNISGITSWVLWRSAYLTRLGSWRLRFQVPFDWLKAILFGRDISRF